MIRKITVWIMQQTKKTLRMEISGLQLKIQAESMAGKIQDLPGKLAHPEVRSLSGHTVFAKLKSKKEVSSACGVLRSSNY